VWDHLDRERNKRQPTSKEELWDVLQEVWRTIPVITVTLFLPLYSGFIFMFEHVSVNHCSCFLFLWKYVKELKTKFCFFIFCLN